MMNKTREKRENERRREEKMKGNPLIREVSVFHVQTEAKKGVIGRTDIVKLS